MLDRPDDAIELLLNHIDDRTLEKLEPVADKLTGTDRQDPETFMSHRLSSGIRDNHLNVIVMELYIQYKKCVFFNLFFILFF